MIVSINSSPGGFVVSCQSLIVGKLKTSEIHIFNNYGNLGLRNWGIEMGYCNSLRSSYES